MTISWLKRANGSIFIADVNSRDFHWFPAAITVSLSKTQIWRFHTKLYKSVWNILTHNLSTEYRTVLRLGKVNKLLASYNIPKSWLFLPNSLIFFSLRDSENQQYFYCKQNYMATNVIELTKVRKRIFFFGSLDLIVNGWLQWRVYLQIRSLMVWRAINFGRSIWLTAWQRMFFPISNHFVYDS